MKENLRADERFLRKLQGEEVDRQPVVENSLWWDLTIKRWVQEGLPLGKNYVNQMTEVVKIQEYFGLDLLANWWALPYTAQTPFAKVVGAGMGAVSMESYEKLLLPTLYPEPRIDEEFAALVKRKKAEGSMILELIFNGPFWQPREYMGIEPHLFAFYDQPELYQRMVYDMKLWQKKVIDYAMNTLPFDYVTFAEDMSYNNGPLLGKEHFDEFIAPFYCEMVPLLKEAGLMVLVDSDGDIGEAIDWYNGVGVEGYHPLEKQAGVDINELCKRYPNTAFIGNYNKMIMHCGEEAQRREFERIAPCMRKARYVVSVDHQTPPDVSLNDYKTYVRLLKEYSAVR